MEMAPAAQDMLMGPLAWAEPEEEPDKQTAPARMRAAAFCSITAVWSHLQC
jgi:hypothetical protein